MNPRLRAALPLLLAAAGALLIAAFFLQPVRLSVDGQEVRLRGFLLSGADALRAAGLSRAPGDRFSTSPQGWIPADGRLRLERARPVFAWVNGVQMRFDTPERIPANWMVAAALRLYPGDRVLVGGREVDPLRPASPAAAYTLQVLAAQPVDVNVDGALRRVYSSAPTLGGLLWQAGLSPAPGDEVSLPLDTPLTPGLAVELRRARPLAISAGGKTIQARSTARTVGEALRDAGLAPQGLDYSQPAEDQPLPADGKVRLVRVSETIALAEKLLPYQNHFTTSADLELDQRQVIQPGQYGVEIERERVRLEDGQETGRVKDGSWTAAQARDQITGLGMKAVPHKLDTPDGSIEYYRAVTVYATSYSPCQQGYAKCSLSTSSGALLKKGIVAVSLAWYRLLKGGRVYIPGYGYGVIADVGGGIGGAYWIDLGYSDEDYQQWNQNVTLYFLTPAPASVPAILP